MCFGSKSSTPATPTPPSPGIIDVAKVAPDPTQAYKYRGGEPAPNETGRVGGGLLLDARDQQQAKTTTLGGA